MRWLILCLFVLLCACSSRDNAENTMNVDENLTVTEVNATTEMNVDMNAVDVNAAGSNMADSVEAVPTPPAPPPPPPGEGPPENAATKAAASQVQQGLGAFVVPPQIMRPQQWYKIDFIVAITHAAMAEEADSENTTAAKQVNVAPTMRVTLQQDANFEMKALTPEVQPLGQAATWSWNIKPLREGTFFLEAKVTPQVGPNSKAYTRKVPVQVKVGMWTKIVTGINNGTSLGDALTKFFKSWQGALVAFLAFWGVLLTVLWKLGVLRKKPASAEPTSNDQEEKG